MILMSAFRNKISSIGLRGLCLVGVAAVLGACGDSASDPTAQWALVEQYCVDCHNDAEYTADISFEGVGPAQITEHAELFETVVRKLRGRMMPPPGEPQPEEAAVFGLVSYLEGELDSAGGFAHLPDEVILHRLNRKEYQNAIADLLDMEVDAATLLPQDDVAENFDNIAAALQVSPSFIEQYVIAARSIAIQAVGQPNARPGGATYEAGPGRQLTHVKGAPLGTRGGIVVTHHFPSDGEYVIDVADMATHIWGNGMEFENPLVVTLDGRIVYETVVGGEEDMRLYDQVRDGALDRVNERLKGIRFQATAGPHQVGVNFRRQTFAESDDRLQQFLPGGGQERLYRVRSFQVLGPFNASGLSSTPSREKIFICHPDRGDDPRLCAEEIITNLATRAYRRPLSETDLIEILEYYDDGLAAGGFEEGIRSALTGILASPFFLYRGERVPGDLTAGTPYAIDDLELASRLSFFLWNTIPDDELLQLAAAGTLSEPATLEAQMRRMLADPRAASLGENFVYQWLDMKRIDEVLPDSTIYPYASGVGDPRDNYLTELALFSNSIFAEDRSVVDLMTADHTYLNEATALNYDIHSVRGDHFRRVQLEDPRRFGLLGKGAVRMAAAYPTRTSPVLRGAFVLEHILGLPPALPPPNVEALPEDDLGTEKALTVRELMAIHRENPACFSCHAVMDPLGFALENFDATGAWRDIDRYAQTAIDASGELPDGTAINGPIELRDALLRRPEEFVQTFTEELMKYALGRTLEYYDMPTVRRIVREAAAQDHRLSAIVHGIVSSEQFRMRRVPGAQIAARND